MEEHQEEATKKAEELFQITQQATTARFCQYENSLIFDAVFMTSDKSSVEKKLDNLKYENSLIFDAVFMTSDKSSVEKKLDNLKDELRFYFDE